MTPTNAIFNQLYIISEQIMDTYDYLPDAEARYPFCYVGNPDNIQPRNERLNRSGDRHGPLVWKTNGPEED